MTLFGEAVSPDGLTLEFKRNLNLEEWSQTLALLSDFSVCTPFWVGDMLVYGSLQYGENYAQGIPEGISPSTLRSYQWVAERVPPAIRHPGLSWSHHRAVSALEPVEQSALLDQAEAEGWSVRELAQWAKGQEPQAQEKARVFKAMSYAVSELDDDLRSVAFFVSPDDALEINARLQAGKRVTIES